MNNGHPIEAEHSVRELHDLPSLPQVVLDILRSTDQEDVDISVMARKVSHDQALTAKTLRLANSAFYGSQAKVTTIQQAIALIGVEAVHNLVVASVVPEVFPAEKYPSIDFHVFWRHSIATAVCARSLARHLHVNQDYAFTAGLLHDIGRLVLASSYPQEYEAVLAYRREHDTPLLQAEQAVLGVDHVVTGQALAEHWNFSDPIQHAISGHHSPESLRERSLASIIHVANAIVHALDLSADDDDLAAPVSQVAWDGLNLPEEIYQQVFRETELQFEEVGNILLDD